jgi:hypothetical protein
MLRLLYGEGMTSMEAAKLVARELNSSNPDWNSDKDFKTNPGLSGSIASQIALAAGGADLEFITVDSTGLNDPKTMTLDVSWFTKTMAGSTIYFQDDGDVHTTIVARDTLSELTVMAAPNLVSFQDDSFRELSIFLKYDAFELSIPGPGASSSIRNKMGAFVATLHGDL